MWICVSQHDLYPVQYFLSADASHNLHLRLWDVELKWVPYRSFVLRSGSRKSERTETGLCEEAWMMMCLLIRIATPVQFPSFIQGEGTWVLWGRTLWGVFPACFSERASILQTLLISRYEHPSECQQAKHREHPSVPWPSLLLWSTFYFGWATSISEQRWWCFVSPPDPALQRRASASWSHQLEIPTEIPAFPYSCSGSTGFGTHRAGCWLHCNMSVRVVQHESAEMSMESSLSWL